MSGFAKWVSRVCAGASVVLVSLGAFAVAPRLEVRADGYSGSLPKGVTLAPDGFTLYVTNYGHRGARNLAVFDARSMRRVRTFDLPGIPVETAVSRDGATVYASDFARNAVLWIDARNGRVRREARVGARPKIVVQSPDGSRLFAANWSGHTVTELDARTGAVVRTLRAGRNPRGMAVTSSGRLYVANFNGHSIDIYEGASMEHHRRLDDVCRIPRHLGLSPDEQFLYVTCFSASELAVIDTRTDRIVRRVSVGHWPKALDVSPDGRLVYTANYGGSSVSVVDTTDWTSHTIDVPLMDHASGIAAARDGVGCYVTGWYDGHLFALGDAGSGAGYTVPHARRALTLRQREFHRLNPVE